MTLELQLDPGETIQAKYVSFCKDTKRMSLISNTSRKGLRARPPKQIKLNTLPFLSHLGITKKATTIGLGPHVCMPRIKLVGLRIRLLFTYIFQFCLTYPQRHSGFLIRTAFANFSTRFNFRSHCLSAFGSPRI